MVSQRPSLLIDTNVWLDYFLPDRAGGKEAIDLIVFAFEYEFPLLYPAAIVKDVFYVAVSTFKRIARAEKGSLTQSDAVTATETCSLNTATEKKPYRFSLVTSFEYLK